MTVQKRDLSPLEYITNRISPEPNTGCWIWDGSMSAQGYGKVPKGKLFSAGSNAHRAVYTLLVGPIRPWLVLDHKCRNRWCVNPAHMEPVTEEENAKRGAEARRGPRRDWLVPTLDTRTPEYREGLPHGR